jgi:hypothetical protein
MTTIEHPTLLPTEPSKARTVSPSPQIGRRGLLGALLALVPASAAAGATFSLPSPAAPVEENPRLLRLFEQLDQAAASFAEALAHRARCRELAVAAYPEPPADITWLPGEHPPAWCAVDSETDVDGKIVYWKGDPERFRSTPRRIARAVWLKEFLEHEDGRTKDARAARRMVPIAERYEAAIEGALNDSGYTAARDECYHLAQRISRITMLVYKCECRTPEGVAIKAFALLTACEADSVDDYIVHRSKALYATRLADDVLRLNKAA